MPLQFLQGKPADKKKKKIKWKLHFWLLHCYMGRREKE